MEVPRDTRLAYGITRRSSCAQRHYQNKDVHNLNQSKNFICAKECGKEPPKQ